MGDLLHSDFCVTHGSGVIAVKRTKVTLTIYQLVSHAERLRHTHYRIVSCGVTVGVILTDDITDNPRGFHVRPIKRIIEVVHCEQHSPVHGFQTISDIR